MWSGEVAMPHTCILVCPLAGKFLIFVFRILIIKFYLQSNAGKGTSTVAAEITTR